MLARVTALEYVRPMTSGRTSPLIVNCELPDHTLVTAVTKFSGFCEQNETHLAREVIAALLAGDLGLPIPEPLLVDIPDGWPEVIDDPHRRGRVQASSSVAFGSKLMTGGYVAWTPDTHITESMMGRATAVFAFDAIIQNFDRRSDNPNCLVRGEEFRIIDHELAFAHRLLVGWRGPWMAGSLNWMKGKGSHIFYADLRHNGADFTDVAQKWNTIGDARLVGYRAALPSEWTSALAEVDSAIDLIRNARDKMADCLAELQRVLS